MLNDAWPAVSWSSIDYYGRWKAVQYFAKTLYKDVILFYHPVKNNFVAVNDKLYGVKANYRIEVATFDGTMLFEESGSISLNINEKRELHPLEVKYISGKESRAYVYT
jgi:beta-mannosidase